MAMIFIYCNGSRAQSIPAASSPEQFTSYVCYRSVEPLHIDGKLDDPSWMAVAYSEVFTDIEGDLKPTPLYDTRVKMLWDDEYFYIGAMLDEPHIWATYTERESIIFHENDFEVFLDPDGDTHNYYELEINALNTVWDLLLVKPYRDGGPYKTAWDIEGLKTAVDLKGTINDPADIDHWWTVEIAMPWESLIAYAPGGRMPQRGEQWRINFSRVQYLLDIEEGMYAKKRDPETGKVMKEHNWVWSPQGVINMHQPETWGFVQFSDINAGSHSEAFVLHKEEHVKWYLRTLYYQQRRFRRKNGRYASDLEELKWDDASKYKEFRPHTYINADDHRYVIGVESGNVWNIDQYGRVWNE